MAVLLIASPQINLAIRSVLGISEDPGISSAEKNGIESNLNLVSESNGMQIALTKFIATKRKMAFDYQFKIEDEKLKTLLERNSQSSESTTKNFDFIDIELYAEGSNENLYRGVAGGSTSRIEGDMFYGSVMAVFASDTIPDNTKLTLHITQLAWQDNEEVARAKAEATAIDPMAPFSVDYAAAYEGDWVFDIDSRPLPQTVTPEVMNIHNIENINVVSDALQTEAKFTVLLKKEDSRPMVIIYKDGVKVDNFISTEIHDPTTGDFELTFSLSALDKSNAVYRIELNEIDNNTQLIEEIGSFEIKNE
ncbi:hypothetical protein IW492_03085 [Enterococcus sp. BWB1-3]|nr:hypothetical protein [Enterococcus sp. BWB1-3]